MSLKKRYAPVGDEIAELEGFYDIGPDAANDSEDDDEPKGTGLSEQEEIDLLELIRDLDQLAVPIDGAQVNDRTNGIHYYEGDMHLVTDMDDMVPREEGRSTVTALTVAETLETLLPGLVDIVTDAETITIKKRPGQTTEQQKQETDAVYKIVYQENKGRTITYDCLWDAGVGKYGASLVGHEKDRFGREQVKIWTLDPGDVGYVPTAQNAESAPVWRVVVRMSDQAFEERFGISPEGFAPAPLSQAAENAANETGVSARSDDNRGALVYYIKADNGYLCVTTDYGRRRILEVEEHPELMLQFWGLYRRPHSLVGWSVYDRVKTSQKVNTVLQRNVLDTLQFAQNNRPVIGNQSLLPETIDQLMIDVPGAPVIVKGLSSGAITPLNATTSPPIDVFGAAEYFAADTEARAGAGRNMQGANAEALHESMKVGLRMDDRQQMRQRTMAGHIAEDSTAALFSAAHCMARLCAVTIEVGDETVNCGEWQDLAGVSAEVDTKGGTEALQVQAVAIKTAVTEMVAAQGGINGPMVSGQQVLNAARAVIAASGVKNVDDYLPATYEAPPPAPPAPDPAMLKIQSDKEIADAKLAFEEKKAFGAMQLQDRQAERDHEYRMAELQQRQAQAQLEDQYKRDQGADELELKHEMFEEELDLKHAEMGLEFSLKADELDHNKHIDELSVDTDVPAGDVRPGGDVG